MRRSFSRARIRATQCQSTPGTADAMGERASDEPLPASIQDAVAAAIEDGATMDEIVARVRARGGEGPGSAPPMEGLICLQRETDCFAEEWERTREPGAEGLSALIAIETLRTLALRTMAALGTREEPVAIKDLGRLALALNRIESADRLRIEREQTMADAAAAHDGAAARAASMTHAERVETVRRALEGHLFPGRTDPPPAAFGWAAASAEDSPVTLPKPAPDPPAAAPAAHSRVTPPAPAPDSPADDGAQDAWDAHRARDVCDARRARDSWDAHRARDTELRRREAEGRLWPTDLPSAPRHGAGQGEAGDSASAAAGHALPAPRSRHVERQKRLPHLTPALSAPQGRRGRVGGAAASPLRPSGGGGQGEVGHARLFSARTNSSDARVTLPCRPRAPGNPTYPT